MRRGRRVRGLDIPSMSSVRCPDVTISGMTTWTACAPGTVRRVLSPVGRRGLSGVRHPMSSRPTRFASGWPNPSARGKVDYSHRRTVRLDVILKEINVTSPPHGSRRVLDLWVRSHLVTTSGGQPGSPSTVGGQRLGHDLDAAGVERRLAPDVVATDPGGTPGQGNAEADQRRNREGYRSPTPADPPGDCGGPHRGGGGRRRISDVRKGTSPTGGLTDIRVDDAVSDSYTTGWVPIEFSCGFCPPESSSVKNQRVCPASGHPLRVLRTFGVQLWIRVPLQALTRAPTRASVGETASLNEDTPARAGYPVGSS